MSNLLAALMIFLAGLLAGVYWPVSTKPAGNTEVAMVAPEVGKIEKEEIVPKKLKVYKPGAKDKLPLPDNIKNNKDDHVINASKIKNDDRDHTVITVVNSETGESTTFDHKEPLPWLALERKSEIRLDYGIKRYQAVEYFLGGGVGYRW